MRKRSFCGREASVIALGTMDFGGKIEESRAVEYMDAYLDMGGNLIDTARVYGDFVLKKQELSEQVIGRWISARRNRSEIILSTKGAHPEMHTMHTGRLSHEEILSDASRSLDNLQTERVDIYWLHRDDPSRPVGDIMETLTDLVERGMTAYTGVSNWKLERIREANEYAAAHSLVGIYANQPQFSLARQMVVEDDTLVQMDAEMYRAHIASQMPCMAFSSQAKGFMTKMAQQGENALSDKAKRRYYYPENLRTLEIAKQIAKETGLSVNAVALAYLTSQPFPVFPIAGMSRMEHVEALKEAGDAVLTAEQVSRLVPFR